MIQLIDYGAGNLRSVVGALRQLGVTPRIVQSAKDFDGACPTILPGVGAAAHAMNALKTNGLADLLAKTKVPLLGICLGMQLLGASSAEGNVKTLGLLSGHITKLQHVPKIPHMGWNTIQMTAPHPMFSNIPDDTYCYFAHSFAVDAATVPPSNLIAHTTYGDTAIIAAWGNDQRVGVQFHPEKSGDAGMQLLRNFCTWAGVQ